MATLTVGDGEQYSTISAAVAASHGGDAIKVDAGTYTDDVLNISHSLTLQAVGGTVKLVGTAQPANGKGLIDAGGAGVHVAITGFDISGATVPDKNGAGIRYEGGTLTLSHVNRPPSGGELDAGACAGQRGGSRRAVGKPVHGLWRRVAWDRCRRAGGRHGRPRRGASLLAAPLFGLHGRIGVSSGATTPR